MKKIRTRFAPSPTGFLHVGGLRTALYSYLFAKQNEGDFILRIEDTDKKRQVEKGVEKIVQTLEKFFDWDEGVKMKENKIIQIGEFGPYIQSERLNVYQKYAKKLIEEGNAYYCFCSSDRLEKIKQAQTINKQTPRYDGYCQKFSLKEAEEKIKNGEKFVVRLKIERNKNVLFEDIIRGKISFNTNAIDDQVLLKSDGFPTYHLANVVDDYSMKISHVIRGDEWLSSTPKHILLYQAFGWEIPQFAHLPLLLNSDRSKLSKRQGDVAVEDYLNKGYLRETLLNFIALLGWNPGAGSEKELFSLEELVKKFEIKKVHKGGAVFDLKKLDWMNGQYIKKESSENLLKLCEPYFDEYEKEKCIEIPKEKKFRIIEIEKERIKRLADLTQDDNISFYIKAPDYNGELLIWKKMTNDKLIKSLKISQKIILSMNENNWALNLEKTNDICRESFYPKMNNLLNNEISQEYKGNVIDMTEKEDGEPKKGFDFGEIYWPIRVALSGRKNSPSPAEIAWVIGKEETLKRIENALKKVSGT